MLIREVQEQEKEAYNQVVSHPLQSWEWGEFRLKTGLKVVRLGVFDGKKIIGSYQLTIHPIPYTPYTIGYLPKGPLPDQAMLDSLKKIAKSENCLFLKLEPNIAPHPQIHQFLLKNGCRLGKPLFTQYSFILDLTPSEETIFSKMSPKTRYNIRLAQKNGVSIQEDNSPEAFKDYLKLSAETTHRQGFYAHDEKYHRLMWETLQPSGIARLLTATYQKKVLVTWILFLFPQKKTTEGSLFHDTLYYPYGASSREHRELMASNLMMWEAIKWGKAHGAKTFDLWGALGPNPNPKDPWYGFHRFKEGYGAKLTEFIGTYDLVINPHLYPLYNWVDKLRWIFLKLKNYLPF